MTVLSRLVPCCVALWSHVPPHNSLTVTFLLCLSTSSPGPICPMSSGMTIYIINQVLFICLSTTRLPVPSPSCRAVRFSAGLHLSPLSFVLRRSPVLGGFWTVSVRGKDHGQLDPPAASKHRYRAQPRPRPRSRPARSGHLILAGLGRGRTQLKFNGSDSCGIIAQKDA